MKEQSDTPRTDAMLQSFGLIAHTDKAAEIWLGTVINMARELERKLATTTRERDEALARVSDLVENGERLKAVADAAVRDAADMAEAKCEPLRVRESVLLAREAELETALRELLTDMVIAQGNMRNAVRRGDRMWEGCAEAIQPRVDAARALNAEWAEKAETWMASPEAAQRLQSYRDLAQQVAQAQNERDEAQAELETERLRLAACGVVAMANTPESAARVRDILPKHFSASLHSVMGAVDREMEFRAEVERLRKANEELYNGTMRQAIRLAAAEAKP